MPQARLLFSRISRCRSPDIYLPSMYRQAQGLHITTYLPALPFTLSAKNHALLCEAANHINPPQNKQAGGSDTGSWEVELSRWYSWVFPVALGGGLALIAHKPRCLRIFFIISSSSITLITCIVPEHFGHVSGSTFPDQVRDRLRSSESIRPSSFGAPWPRPITSGVSSKSRICNRALSKHK